jgi:hypothetical protein
MPAAPIMAVTNRSALGAKSNRLMLADREACSW